MDENLELFSKIEYLKNKPVLLADFWNDISGEMKKNQKLFLKVIDYVKDDWNSLFKVWKSTSDDIKKDTLQNVIEFVKYNAVSLYIVWGHTSHEIQEENSGLFPQIIEYMKDSPDNLSKVWSVTSREIQEENSGLFPQIIEYVKDSPDNLSTMWNATSDKIQEENSGLFPQIIEYVKDSPDNLSTMWNATSDKIKEENSGIFPQIIEYMKDSLGNLSDVWNATSDKIQGENFSQIIESFKDVPKMLWLVWFATSDKTQDKFLQIIEYVKDSPENLLSIWDTSSHEIQEENSGIFPQIIEYAKDSPDNLSQVWRHTSHEIQEKNSGLFPQIIECVKDSIYYLSEVWNATSDKIQEEYFLQIIEYYKDNPLVLSVLWNTKNEEEQNNFFIKIYNDIKIIKDDNGNNIFNTLGIRSLIIDTKNIEFLNDFYENLETEEQKIIIEPMIEKWCNDPDCKNVLIENIKMKNKDIDAEELAELLMIKDQAFLYTHMMNHIIKENILKDNIDVLSINNEISKLHDIFLTNNLPEVFKLFEFFKFHPNYMNNNSNLYNGVSNEYRDKIMLQDLITTELESDNSQLLNFLELLYNGDIAYIKKQKGEKLEEIDEAIMASYSDTLLNLYQIYGKDKLKKENDFYKNIENIKSNMHIQEDEKIGNAMLFQFLDEIDFETEKYSNGKETIIEDLLEYMKKDKEKAMDRNSKKVEVSKILEAGDLIKGTDIQYLNSQLRLGIRSKEFYQEGHMSTDLTPFDTDFSEITNVNLQKTGIRNILNSTYSGMGYGTTYYVIKKGDYEEDKSYTGGDDNSGGKTRYIRTSIGSNKISYIITSQWNDAYSYTMAQNGIYIPVIDRETEEVLFTKEQYDSIREKMKGMSFYRADDFEIDETAFNSEIQENAQNMKKQAEGKISTQEKRDKMLELVKKNMPKIVVNDMVGDLSGEILEFIDTGSTGRGTNIPGDGDFDFMLKCSSNEEQSKMIAQMRTFIKGIPQGGDNEFNIRYKDVDIPGLEEKIDLDVTSEKKSLDVEYSSDLCVRDRLDNILKNYGEETVGQVVNNIIVAKKTLKKLDTYKKTGSKDATDNGGFGGIGVENWILQNGGSFILAMETFLDAANESKNLGEFQVKYPIYDFGENHRETVSTNLINPKHDRYILGLTQEGFDLLKEKFVEILKEYGIEYEYSGNGHVIIPVESLSEANKEIKEGQRDKSEKINLNTSQANEEEKFIFFESAKKSALKTKYKISDVTRMNEYFAKLHAKIQMKNKNFREIAG